jgi:hypothetical protein
MADSYEGQTLPGAMPPPHGHFSVVMMQYYLYITLENISGLIVSRGITSAPAPRGGA